MTKGRPGTLTGPTSGWSYSVKKPRALRCGSLATSSELFTGPEGTLFACKTSKISFLVRSSNQGSAIRRISSEYSRRFHIGMSKMGLTAHSGLPIALTKPCHWLCSSSMSAICPSAQGWIPVGKLVIRDSPARTPHSPVM